MYGAVCSALSNVLACDEHDGLWIVFKVSRMLTLCPGAEADCLVACQRQAAHDRYEVSAAGPHICSFLTYANVQQHHLTSLCQAHPSRELHVCRRWQRQGPPLNIVGTLGEECGD